MSTGENDDLLRPVAMGEKVNELLVATTTTSDDGDDVDVEAMEDHAIDDDAIDDDAIDDALFRLSTDFSTSMVGGVMGQPHTLSPSHSPPDTDTNSPQIARHIRLSLPGLKQTMAPGTTPPL